MHQSLIKDPSEPFQIWCPTQTFQLQIILVQWHYLTHDPSQITMPGGCSIKASIATSKWNWAVFDSSNSIGFELENYRLAFFSNRFPVYSVAKFIEREQTANLLFLLFYVELLIIFLNRNNVNKYKQWLKHRYKFDIILIETFSLPIFSNNYLINHWHGKRYNNFVI